MDRRGFSQILIGGLAGLFGIKQSEAATKPDVKIIAPFTAPLRIPLRLVMRKCRRQMICGDDGSSHVLINGVLEFNRAPDPDCSADVDFVTDTVREFVPSVEHGFRRQSSTCTMDVFRPSMAWATLDKEVLRNHA